MISDKTPGSNLSNKGIVKTASAAGGAQTVVIAYYEAGGQAMGRHRCSSVICLYMDQNSTKEQTEWLVLTNLMTYFSTTSQLLSKTKYSVSGSDMAQIGWIEVTTENGANGYLWYLKSEHETKIKI